MLYLDHFVSLRPSCCYSSHVVFRPHRSLRPSCCYSSPVVFRPHRFPSSILMLLFSCCIWTTSFPFVHPDVTLLLLYLDYFVSLRPSWCYSSRVVFRPHRSPSTILMLLFSCCIQTTSFPFVHPDVTLLMLYSDHIVPFVHPVVTLLLLYLDHIVPLRPSWCYSSHVVFRPHRFPSSILMLLFSCCI